MISDSFGGRRKRVNSAVFFVMAVLLIFLLGTAYVSSGIVQDAALKVNSAVTLILYYYQLSLGKGEIFKLKANKTVKWSSSSSRILSVDKNGNVLAVSAGTATITAADSSNVRRSCKITVRNAPRSVSLSQNTLSLGKGESVSLSAVLPSGTASAARTYRSSNNAVVKMTKTNWTAGFTAVNEGTARVYVKLYNGREACCTVRVRKAPDSVKLSRGLMYLKTGQSASLSMIIPDGTGCASRTFRSSNSSVVKMTKTHWTGDFTAVKEGVAYVTGRTYNGRECACKIVVERDESIAVWIPYMALDMYDTNRTESAYTQRIDGIMKNIRDIGADTVIFHAHPYCDAAYESSVFPASHLFSGVQGTKVYYDPLKIAVNSAKKYGLKLQAWVNPLRIKAGETPAVLADTNPYVRWKNDNISSNDRYALECDDGIYLNPAYPEVRQLVFNCVNEIVQKYAVDGIQIDDYFYPDGFDDETEYQDYVKKSSSTYMSKEEWRISNINSMIRGIYSTVHKKSGCVFGIAPQGNVENNYLMSADVRTWCSKKGYADYICPQMYFSEDHPILPFETAAAQWKEMLTEKSIKLYFGLGLYKIGTDADNGTWLLKDDNIRSQMEVGREYGANGFMLYSCQQLSDPAVQDELKIAMKKIIDRI